MDIKGLLNDETTLETLLKYYNTSVIVEKLPSSVHGFVFNYKGSNFIIVNKKVSKRKIKNIIMQGLAFIELNEKSVPKKALAEPYNLYIENNAIDYLNKLK